jgi:hypothetical protein
MLCKIYFEHHSFTRTSTVALANARAPSLLHWKYQVFICYLNVIRSLILFILVFFRYLTLTDPHCRYALSKDRPLYFVNKPNVLWCCSSLPHVKDNCTPAPKQSRVLELIIYSMCRVITVQFNMHAYSLRTKLTIKLVKKIWIICHKSIPLITLFGYEPNDIILKVCVYPYITKSELGM